MKIELATTDQRRTIRTLCAKGFPLILAAVLLAPGRPALANWLDSAAADKSCPATPINVPADVLAGSASGSLLRQITIHGDTLRIQGTDNPDHIMISADGVSGYIRIQWNGTQLGRFGPVSRIVLNGNGGDDVLIVKPGVHLPVMLDGGSGDDCVQGGSGGGQLLGGDGDDVLIAGTGRPALDGGPGNNRTVVPRPMGMLLYAPGADSGVLQALDGIYDLQPLSAASGNSSSGPSPLILGPADLRDEQLSTLLQQVHTAGQAVVITNAMQADSETLRNLLGQPNAVAGSPKGTANTATTPMTFFRAVQRSKTKNYDYSTGLVQGLSGPFSYPMIDALSKIFAATAIVPQAPADSPANELRSLANSYSSYNIVTDDVGNSVQVRNMVWAVRSFQNQADYYYVQQEADYYQIKGCPGICLPISSTSSNSLSASNFVTPAFYQPSPASTQCQTSTTSGMSWSIGGSAGWNATQSLNAALTGGVSETDSQTVTCPATTIVNQSNPSSGLTAWLYATQQYGSLQTYTNQWIWVVPFSYYSTGQKQIAFSSAVGESVPGYWNGIQVNLSSFIPMPFGDTFSLQKPQVTAVNPTCVNAGSAFTVTGSALYPSLVSSVLIDGTPLSSSQYTPVNDTSIQVVAPNQSGDALPVVVQTGLGLSNSNVTIEISVVNLCP
jgi:hypothetical protein